jgi:hypothetical protein
MKKNYTIAVCDILGFTDLVRKNDLDSIVGDHLGWLRKALHHSIHKEKFPSEAPSLLALRDKSLLGLAWFSDTIVLYTLNDTDDSIRALTSCLGWLLFESIFTVGTRLRCGVSYGEAFMDTENSLYVGNPLIDAYYLQQRQDWSGGALTQEAVERLPVEARTGIYYADWFLIPYDVPIKENKTIRTLAIDWTISIHPHLEFPWSDNYTEPIIGDWLKRPDVCRKWHYTKAFHDTVCRSCRSQLQL